eukprot:6202098-Pleurochrysis_carterae.AAC.1
MAVCERFRTARATGMRAHSHWSRGRQGKRRADTSEVTLHTLKLLTLRSTGANSPLFRHQLIAMWRGGVKYSLYWQKSPQKARNAVLVLCDPLGRRRVKRRRRCKE